MHYKEKIFVNNALPYIAKKNTTTLLITRIPELAIVMKLKKHSAKPLMLLLYFYLYSY